MLVLLIEADLHHGYSRVVNKGYYNVVDTELVIEDARAELKKKSDMHFDCYYSIACIDRAGKMYELDWETAELTEAKEIIVSAPLEE